MNKPQPPVVTLQENLIPKKEAPEIPIKSLRLMAVFCPWMAVLCGWSNRQWSILHQVLSFAYATGIFAFLWSCGEFFSYIPPPSLSGIFENFFNIAFLFIGLVTGLSSIQLIRTGGWRLITLGIYGLLNAVLALVGVSDPTLSGILVLMTLWLWPFLVGGLILYMVFIRKANTLGEEFKIQPVWLVILLLILGLGWTGMNYPFGIMDNQVFYLSQGWELPYRD